MKSLTVFKKSGLAFIWAAVLVLAMSFRNDMMAQAQTTRNPVLEFCTGTWCQWCPCGDSLVIKDILPNIPNAIILAYHGPANYASEPFSFFPGNTILSLLSFNAYPTGIIDRVTGIQSRNVWLSQMQNRLSTPATVKIDLVSRSYNRTTRQFKATFDFTALKALSGEYKYNLILVEDEVVYGQTSNHTCTPGKTYIPDFVHEWLVRDMMNGALGEQLINGTWNQNQVIRKTIEHTVPVPSAPAPNIVPDHCRIVAMVYEVIPSLPLNNYAEIQQAEQWSLISPGYLASLRVSQHEVLGKSSVPAQFTAVLKNAGQVADTYTIGLSFNGPTGWMPSFMTKNGTFALGQTDKLTLSAGDSALINVMVDAKSIVGFGKTFLEIASPNFTLGATELRFATYGLNALLVDDDPERDHQTYLENALNHVGETYGTVSSRAILAAADLQGFNVILWMSDLAKPTLDSTEQVVLANYLDHGGKLFLNGLDIAYELADSTSPYYSARSREFFKNYLHAVYVKRNYSSVVASGISGDPITDGMAVVGLTGGTGARTIDPAAGRYANQINAADAEAVPIFQFYQKPGDYLGIRAIHRGAYGTGKVVFTTFGFETINKDADRDLLASRVVNWLRGTTRVDDAKPAEVISRFELKPNYPNPFNPGTLISYVLPNSEGDRMVSLVILNQLGQTVRVLINHPQGPGAHQVTWDGRDAQGKPLVSGVFFYKLQFGTYQETRKMVLLR